MRYRKPTASIVNNVGIWHDIMVGLARIAVITNAFLIAVTSDFIPRLVYTTYHSYTGKGFTSYNRFLSLTLSGTLVGYVNFTLAYFNTSELDRGVSTVTTNTSHPAICR